LEQRIADGANAKDVGAIMKNFAPDETLLVFDVIPLREYRGADAFRKDWEGFFDRFGSFGRRTRGRRKQVASGTYSAARSASEALEAKQGTCLKRR